MGHQVVLLVIFLCYHLVLVNKVQCIRNPSKQGEHDVEFRTEFFNKPSNKILQYEDMIQSGTNMIQRNISTDLIKDRQVSEATANRPHTYLAVARTKDGSGKYSGGAGNLKIDNPTAVGKQYSACRLRLHAGYDSIEAGWRVDPDIYGGDSQTRFYIRTDGAKTHCFNTRCPGFVLTRVGFNFDLPVGKISKPGETVIGVRILIVRDNVNGNWILKMGDNKTEIGYWPPHLFNGLAGLADLVEWGGAVYSPPGTPLPPMGSGRYPGEDSTYDGVVSEIKVLDERGQESEALNVETYADNSRLYVVRDTGFQTGVYRHTIVYGGPGHPKS